MREDVTGLPAPDSLCGRALREAVEGIADDHGGLSDWERDVLYRAAVLAEDREALLGANAERALRQEELGREVGRLREALGRARGPCARCQAPAPPAHLPPPAPRATIPPAGRPD